MFALDEIDHLFRADLPTTSDWERRYPPRRLDPQAQVTRFCPSPTGSAHLDGVFVAILDRAVAHDSGGVYFLRIEDTDQEREVNGAVELFSKAFTYFGVMSDEPEGTGLYGPYTQLHRSEIYQSYVRELLRSDKAYLCFCTKDDLARVTEAQRAAKVPTGYYGSWARCRDNSAEQVRANLAAGSPTLFASDRLVTLVGACRSSISYAARSRWRTTGTTL